MARPPIPFRNLTQLLAPAAGRLVFDLPDAAQAAVDAAYRARLAALGQWSFWTKGAADYRPVQGLRAPQRRAVAFVQAYLAARQISAANAQRESALIKMPTGTGKTGIIAAIACAQPGPFKTLVLTPRKALVRQMARDLSTKFWRNLGAAYTADGLQEGLGQHELDEIAKRQKGRGSPIRILSADQYATIWEERERDQQIWVGTFNALHRLLQIEPPAHRDLYGREVKAAAASLANLEPDDIGDPTEEFRALIRSADLVIVDEGHHEPAYSWAQAVRSLGKPTVVLSATPYRNDYKYFELSGRFVFNLSWAEAVDQELIREVVVQPPSAAGTVKLGPNGRYGAAQFVYELAPDLANLPPGKKAIVHAGSLADLKAIQRAFFERTGERTVLIHDRIRGKEKEEPGDLKGLALAELQPLRFAEVHHATGDIRAQAARVWLHQYKLLEGIDDPSFIEIWLYDGFGSARQLIQQIGRAIRRPDVTDAAGATAIVRGSSQRLKTIDGAPTVAELTQRRWDAYLEFERYAAERPEIAFTAETQLLPLLKRSSPAVQYLAGEFRGAHWLEQIPSMEAFVLPQRGIFTRLVNADPNDAAPISDDFMDAVAKSAAEAMQLEDRFDIAPVQPTGLGAPFNDVRMVRYLVWRNSPLLRAHQIPEWRLGVLIMVRAGAYVVMLDTEGNCLDHNRLGLVAPEVTELRRLFAKAAADQPNRVRIVETTARGLDLSELGLRSISVRRHALDAGYFDLAEASQTPTSVVGYTPNGQGVARRRLSFSQSSVADAANQLVSVHDYAVWAQRLARVMTDAQVIPHHYFNRFAKEVSPLDVDAAAPRSILLDVRDLVPEPGSPGDVGWNRSALNAMLEADTCLEVMDDHDKGANTHRYSFTFNGHQIGITYNFRKTIPAYGKYILSSETLNKELTKKDEAIDEVEGGDDEAAGENEIDTFGQKIVPSITRMINGEQAFQIITSQSGTIYSHGHFYRPDLAVDLLSLLEGDPTMVPVISEKGDTRLTDAKEWGVKTLFGLVDTWKNAQGLAVGTIGADIAACDTLICDDSTSETADFYGIDTKGRRVFVVHAKADNVANPTASARKLQEVARQALTSLALTGSARQSFPRPDTWNQDWSVELKAAGNTILTRPRLWKDLGGNIDAAHQRLCDALSNSLFTTEIVVLSSGLLGQGAALKAFQNRSLSDLQFLYYLATVRSVFDRAGVRFRLVCNP
ncbi:DEAD/DEAH box helicase family protein [Roseomonas eburnea]|uniref:DEAD/DEAH box helicase family protein n=1 Tax=Neoroseomonas eburnea TaxID=1346889 RepID=A0A9X9XK39_9PROT|nr:DEAD/DEAH box helicase family protein [Neoroseomonas eburnea]MBR0684075.1 DEAD/DEAH box helicase family protein [Neoroseomonas eburnea]